MYATSLVKNRQSENVITPGILSAATKPTAFSRSVPREEPPSINLRRAMDSSSNSSNAVAEDDDVGAFAGGSPTSSGATTRKFQTNIPVTIINTPGMIKLIPQFEFRSAEAAKMLPSMFPTDVCAFHTPMINPLLPLPNQFPMTLTTDGHPVDCITPATICTAT